MARIAKSSGPMPGVGTVTTLKVIVSEDGNIEFVPPTQPSRPQAASNAAPAPAITVDLDAAADEALIAANRARITELRSLPSSRIPEFPDALVASAMRLVPGLTEAMTMLALKDAAGLLPEDAMIAGAKALGHIANWLADRGCLRDASELGSPVPGLLYENAVGVVSWLLLDWIHRSIASTEVDDSQLEDDLDAYYPRWSCTDFEWDITRSRQRPLLNPYPATAPDASHSTEEPSGGAAPAIVRRRVHTSIPRASRFARTAVHSVAPSTRTDHHATLNHAHERRL